MSSVIVTFEGINLTGELIVRELSLHFIDDNVTRHYFFNPPSRLELTRGNRQTVRYHREILGGIPLREDLPGAIPHSTLDLLLLSLSEYRIIVAGNVAARFIASKAPDAEVEDIQQISDFTYPPTMMRSFCGYYHRNDRHCSMSKLWILRNHVLMMGI